MYTLFVPTPAFLGGFWSDDDDYLHPPPLSHIPPPPPLKVNYLHFWVIFW